VSRYLLDTNICIAHVKGLDAVEQRFRLVGKKKILISEITLAELKYGAIKSDRPDHHTRVLEQFMTGISVLPISAVLDAFAMEKARLKKLGQPISDFDLLIGATAIHHDLTLVTNNTRHFQRLQGIRLEDWTK
jgi:tRNA(fMet)-specific endonuclease VapC